MSTILKALQKLEQEKETTGPSGVTPVFSRPQTTAGGLAGWSLNPWVRRTAVGLIILALSVTATYYYRRSQRIPSQHAERSAVNEKSLPSISPRRQQTGPQAVVPGAVQKPDAAKGAMGVTPDPAAKEAAPVPTVKSRTAGSKPIDQRPALPKASGRVASRPAQASNPPAPGDALGRLPGTTIQPAEPGEASAPEIPASLAGGKDDANPPVKAQAVSVADKGEKAAPDAYTNTPKLTDGRLKIHAIAWSRSVEERMAVVNNRVVYEGDSVDSFVVVAIRPDDVVVREKDKGLWKVVFGRP